MLQEAIFAAVLLIAGALITAGAAIAHPSAGFVVGGLLLAGWSWLILGDTDTPNEVDL